MFATAKLEREGHVEQGVLGMVLQPAEKLSDLVGQTRAIGGREQDRLGLPVAEGTGATAVGGGRVLFEHGVGIDTGEAERIDASPARHIFIGVDPRAGDRIQSERAPGTREQLLWMPRVQSRRQYAMKQREGRLDQSRHTGRGHGMADHRRDGPQSAASVGQGGKDGLEGSKLRPVRRGHSQAVALDEHDGSGIDSRPAIGFRMAQACPPRWLGCGQALALAIAGQPDSLNDGIDSIAVAFGVGPPLEHDNAHALARNHSVGIGCKGPRRARRRQGVELAKYQRKIDVGLEVDAPS